MRFVLIAGPTASGKSALALALARRLGSAVVNADASQVYADLRILTARPGAGEAGETRHELYGHVDAAEPYAVGRWLSDVHSVLNSLRTGADAIYPQPGGRPAQAHQSANVPIIVGGTGLYFEGLTRGLVDIPEIPEDIRAKWRAAAPADLHPELARRDPVMAARLRPSDPQRLARALEVLDATGRSLADWQQDLAAPLIDPEDALRMVLSPERAALRERIARRLDAMIGEGAVEEAARLDARGLDPALPAMKALGVRPFAAARRGDLTLDEAVERTRLATGRYAKRQSTWFRNRMADWLHVAPEEALDVALREIEERGIAEPTNRHPGRRVSAEPGSQAGQGDLPDDDPGSRCARPG
ncbi:tRNA (adenosine(37)-N6)-dimethylallyltransferase MiaA [Hansschlegelia zhihuaiae]|uniref:tRNA dimethylallyltransferase n=1 Tax=Hansschlegelia zhihuaiae TaxID=405005 RepID=A0A4Q0ML26_9HYPH|nr:tRNA (adenosine(37)-N6)-dimethylallyltransferase MiaA [Hansschlegelia zhihuaiae]RXF74348.1 tRNA (adenosine(37)-N6)-dimethylallyltransferase MiaA [Hansschlegelia zhihuaiae]